MPPKKNLEIVSGAAPPPFRPPAGGFAGGLPRRLRRRKRFGLIQVFCKNTGYDIIKTSARLPASGENHILILGKENFLSIEFIRFLTRNSRSAVFLIIIVFIDFL